MGMVHFGFKSVRVNLGLQVEKEISHAVISHVMECHIMYVTLRTHMC